MTRRKVLGLSLVLASGLTTSALSQTSPITVPKAFMWAPTRPAGWASYGNLTPKVHLDTNYPVPGTSLPAGSNPYAAGRWCAEEAIRLVNTPGAPSDFKVDILIKEFGIGADPYGNQPDPVALDDRFFFRTQDSLTLPPGFQWPDLGDPTTTKSYLHPFLVNAGVRTDLTGTPPLKRWMMDFVRGYKDITSTPPAAVRFDNEVNLAPAAGPNPVALLGALSQTPYWFQTWPQGSATSLASLYAVEVAANGWNPAIYAVGPNGENLGQIDPSHNAIDYGPNREVMIWWYGVCQQARNEVLRFSAYDVIHSGALDPIYNTVIGWPQTDANGFLVKCGNYDDLNTDGVEETTGWFTDRKWDGNQDTSNMNEFPWPDDRARQWNKLPRADLGRSFGGALYYLNSNRRWWGLKKKASGEVDCPVLYQLQTSELTGDDWRPGLQQVNEYKGSYEEFWETVMRVARHSVESTINSNGGLHEGRLIPWVQAPGTSFLPNNPNIPSPIDGTRFQHEIAQMLAMLRAKNVPAVQFFYDKNVGAPANPEDLTKAWLQSSQVLHQVWATRAAGYKTRLTSEPAHDVAAIEYTLKKVLTTGSPAIDYEASLPNIPDDGSGEGGTSRQSLLTVDFNWVKSTAASPNGVDADWRSLMTNEPDYTGATDRVWVQVEYATDRAATMAEVLIWHAAVTGQPAHWQGHVVHYPYPSGDSVPADANGYYRYRLGCEFPLIDSLIRPVTVQGVQKWQSKVRLKLDNEAGAFNTTVDLVQLYPFWIPPTDTTEAPETIMYSPADVNLDGVVDLNDLVQFLGDWTDELPPADLDMNDSVDIDDFVTFVEAM